MAARDNVIFHASVGASTAGGTVIPLSLLYGIENVRVGMGTPTLKNIRALYCGIYGSTNFGVGVEIKNSQWIDSAGLRAQAIGDGYALSRNSLAFMRGRDKTLSPNTSWSIAATIEYITAMAGDIYVILEIEYSDVPGKPSADVLAGSPVMKKCRNASVTAAANVPTSIGTFDNLLQGVDYVLSEVEMNTPSGSGATDAGRCYFMILEGFANQRGLCRIFPVRNFGMAEQIEGSVILNKQTYNLSIISSAALSAAPVEFDLEMIASSN